VLLNGSEFIVDHKIPGFVTEITSSKEKTGRVLYIRFDFRTDAYM